MTSRSRTAAAAALAALLTLAACTGSSKKAEPEQIALRVGVLFTTGGKGGDLASAVLGSAALAANAAAKDRVKIETVEVDYAGDTTKVAAAVSDLSTKVDAIVVGTDDGDIVGSLAAAATVPLLHPLITTDAAVTSDGRVFRLAPTNRLQAEKLVRYLTAERKYTKIAILADDTPFGAEGLADLRDAFSTVGVAPVDVRTFTPGGDVHTPAAAVAQRGAQAVILWVESAGEAARIVVDVHHSGYAYQLALSGNLATYTFAKNASSQVAPVAFRDGMLSVGAWAGPWFPLQRIVGFYRQFRESNSAIAPVQAAPVYDSVLALAKAARASGTTAEDLVRGLEGLTDFEGAGVPITFGPGNHEGVDIDDVAILGFTKDQTAPGGDFAPDVTTGGGFFSVVTESLDLPPKYAYLKNVS